MKFQSSRCSFGRHQVLIKFLIGCPKPLLERGEVHHSRSNVTPEFRYFVSAAEEVYRKLAPQRKEWYARRNRIAFHERFEWSTTLKGRYFSQKKWMRWDCRCCYILLEVVEHDLTGTRGSCTTYIDCMKDKPEVPTGNGGNGVFKW